MLMEQAWQIFLENPLLGIGAGQFQNYGDPGRAARWRVTHNALLQVAAELGVFALVAFGYLIVRAFAAAWWTRKRAVVDLPARCRTGQAAAGAEDGLDEDERRFLQTTGAALLASIAGWFVCAMFASVAFNWTFYYLLGLAVASRRHRRGAAPTRGPRSWPARERRGMTLCAAPRRKHWLRRPDAPDPGRQPDGGELRNGAAGRPGDGRRPARALRVHRQRGAGPPARNLWRADPGTRGDRSAPRRAEQVGRLPDVRLHVGDAAPRRPSRIQMFHGVAGKYGFDAPSGSMREWHRLFFVNERRLRNFIAAGAIDRRQRRRRG